jgi:hypothetical protein
MNYLPESLRFAAILCGEVAGAAFFRILLDRCDLFREQPDVEERLRLVTGEILADEIGHVAFCRARVAPGLLAAARAALPRVGSALLREMPEFSLLAGGRREVMRRMGAGLPAPPAFAFGEVPLPTRA